MLTGKKTLSVATILIALGAFQQSGIIEIIPDNYKGVIVSGIGLTMAILRFMTKTPV